MRIGIYNPYFHILGGGEKYCLSIAKCLSRIASVDLFVNETKLLKKAEDKFGEDLHDINEKLWQQNLRKRQKLLQDYEYFFYTTDGSLFWSAAKRNFLIIQSPAHIPPQTLKNRLYLKNWHHLICYSEYVRRFILIKYPTSKILKLFVPVTVQANTKSTKKKLIISVGRFFTQLHNKKQLEMVNFFSEFIRRGLPKCQLIIIGSVDPGAEEYVEKIKKISQNLPIRIMTNISYNELCSYYRQAKIYWHAAGFGEDLDKTPEKAEHFGVTTVEAMSYGAVPVVFAAGGQVEIVTHGIDGFLWRSREELYKSTKQLLADNALWHDISKRAQLTSKTYTPVKFCQRLNEIIKSA